MPARKLNNYVMALDSTQSLREMSNRNLPASKGRLAHKADNLTTQYSN
jgi:hypothetical protein